MSETRFMKFLRSWSLFVLFCVAAVSLTGPLAWAGASITVEDHLEDTVSVLNSDARQTVEEEISHATDAGVNLYVVLTDEFSAGSADKWCTATGEKSGLADNAVIYALAVEERSYAICSGPNAPLGSGDLTAAASAAAKKLKGQDVTGKTVTAAVAELSDQLVSRAAGGSGAAGREDGSSGASQPASQLDFWVPFILICAIGLVGLFLIYVLVKFGHKLSSSHSDNAAKLAGGTKVPPISFEQAGVLLMQTDDEVRAAADDLAFARAQFGTLETESFQSALNDAEVLVRQAFSLQSQGESADPTLRAQLAAQMVQLCNRANATIDRQVDAFNALRNVESNAEGAIADLRERIGEARERVGRARSELDSLRLTYSEQTLHSITDNPEQAEQLLNACEQTLGKADQALSTDRSQTVHLVTLAQRAFGKAMSEIEEVLSASQDLEQASTRLTEAIASISSDIEDVDRLASRDLTFGPLVQDAEAAIASAHQARREQADPLLALSRLRQAEDELDVALSPLREKEAKARKQAQRLRSQFLDTDAMLRRAKSFISSRRAVASPQVRALLSRAEEQREQAYGMRESDPDNAIEFLKTAKVNAQRALDAAQSDYDRSDFGSSGRSRSGSNRNDIDLASMILGGILFGSGSHSSSGGFGQRSGGWGSSGWSGGSSSWGSGGSFGGWSSGGSGKF